MKIGKSQRSISKESIFREIDDSQVLSYYLGIDTLPCVINSPLREDRNPSFALFEGKDKVRFYDYGTGDYGDILDLLSKLWRVDFYQVIDRLATDLSKMCTNKACKRPKVKIKNISTCRARERVSVQLRCRVRPWREHDVEYWGKYGISQSTASRAGIYPISHILFTKGECTEVIGAEKYAYAYVWKRGDKVDLKIYQPYSTTRKWFSNQSSNSLDLWDKIPDKGDILIITSSRKDALCIWENTGIPALSPRAEGIMPDELQIEQLKARFCKIGVLYDCDFDKKRNTGRIFGAKICRKFGLNQMEIPPYYQAKDPSDFCLQYGRGALKVLIFNLIKNQLKQ